MSLVFSIKDEENRYKVSFLKGHILLPEVSIYLYKDNISNDILKDTEHVLWMLERAEGFLARQAKLGGGPQKNIESKKLKAELAAMIAAELMHIHANQGE